MNENPSPLLEVKDLCKYFPIYSGIFRRQIGVFKAVDGISFDLYPQKVLGIVGESGSGKSTTVRAIIRLIEPTSGQIYFEGQNLTMLKQKQLKGFRRQAQIVFQDPYASLNPRKTIGDSIGEPLIFHRIVDSKSEKEDRVAEILFKVGMPRDMLHRYPHELSGGQQQRVCIARAIILNPKLVICDEAVSALDVSVQAQILNLLSDLKQEFGLSYLFVSHDLSVVKYLADDVIVMHQGKVVESGTTASIFEQPEHDYTKNLLSSIPQSAIA
ncbi:MAG: dipeptide ABC transporter ATP-binding protein [Chlamydiales bacterium]